MRVSDYLKDMLLAGNTSVTKVAKRLRTSRPNISNVINGNRALTISMAQRIEQQFGLDARRLLHDQLDEQIAKEVMDARRRKAV